MEQLKPDTSKLIELIKELKINIPLLAEKSGMKLTTFRNKMYHPNPIYFFTPEEFLSVVCGINNIATPMRAFIEAQQDYFNEISNRQKSKKLS